MDDAGFVLQLAGRDDEAGADDDRAQTLEGLRPDDEIGDSRLVLQRHEDHPLRRARPLAHQHQPGDGDAVAGLQRRQRLGAPDAARVEAGAHEGDRMRFQRQRQAAVVLDHMGAERHRRQLGVGLAVAFGAAQREQRQIVLVADAAEAAHRPQSLAAVEAERTEGVGVGEPLQRRRLEAGAQPQVAHGIVARAAPLDQPPHLLFLARR